MPNQQFTKVFVFLDSDKHASAFDILTTIDVFPEASILKYENVSPEDVEEIVHDAMFPRGPDGAKHTKIFLNGHNIDRTNQILERIRKSMFPPFELAVIVDPRGAYTTAAAAVAKTLDLSLSENLGELKNKTVTVLAGSGPVGQTATRLFAAEKASVTVTSRSLQKATALAAKVNEELKTQNVQGVEAQSREDLGKAIQTAEIVLAAGAAGIQVLPLNVLKEFGKKCRIVVDVNAVPPLGVEGLDSDADGKEILPHVLGVGALALGKSKNRIESEIIRKAADAPDGIFDYTAAFELAKQRALEKSTKKASAKAEPEKHWLP